MPMKFHVRLSLVLFLVAIPTLAQETSQKSPRPITIDDFEWSPDSTRLVLILRDPKPEDLEAAKGKEKPAAGAPAKPKTPPFCHRPSPIQARHRRLPRPPPHSFVRL